MSSGLPSSSTPSPKRPYNAFEKLIFFVLGTMSILVGLSQLVELHVSGKLLIQALLLIAFGIVLLAILIRNKKSANQTAALSDSTDQNDSVNHSSGIFIQAPTSRNSSAFDLTMSRSNNIPASLKDLVDTGQLQRPELQEILATSGLLAPHRAPATKGYKFPKNQRYWFNAQTSDFTEDQYNDFIALEATLNLADDMEALPANQKSLTVQQKILITLRNTLNAIPQPSEYLPAGKTSLNGATDWDTRYYAANYFDTLHLPFRQPILFTYDEEVSTIIIDAKTPAPRAFCFATSEKNTQISYARAYALRAAITLAYGPLKHQGIARVVVNQFMNENISHPLLSYDFDLKALEHLISESQDPSVDTTGFPQQSCIRYSLDEEGWFTPVEPFEELNDPAKKHPLLYDSAETRTEEAPQEIREITGAKRISDLGFREDSNRIDAWNAVISQLSDSTADAVALFRGAQASATDTATMEAFSRVIQALVSGEADVGDKRELAHIFMSGSELDAAIAHMNEVFDAEDVSIEAFTASMKALEAKLEPIVSLGIYLDDTDSVYRYFDSIADRIDYNRAFSSDPRTVILVPDAYYNANALLVRAYNQVDKPEKALAFAEECVRIAPLNTDAFLYKDRVLQDLSRNAEAAKNICELIPHQLRQYDIALLYYRLAYLEWRLGRGDIAVACYQQVLRMNTEYSQPAQQELSDLMKTDPALVTIDESRLDEFLETHGIPVDNQKARYDILLSAAIACTNNKLYTPASFLTRQALAIKFDDEIESVRLSLTGFI